MYDMQQKKKLRKLKNRFFNFIDINQNLFDFRDTSFRYSMFKSQLSNLKI